MTQSASNAVLIALIPLPYSYVEDRLSVSLSKTRTEIVGSELFTHKKRESETGVKQWGEGRPGAGLILSYRDDIIKLSTSEVQ